jgi:5-methylcytosine-specific restriction endonuclease McrA
MNAGRLDLAFIERCMSEEFQKEVVAFRKFCIWKSNDWQRKNPEKQRMHVKNYFKTEKGKKTANRQIKNYRERLRSSCKGMTQAERKEISEFYCNCPDGYEVDHIIPISKGGKHEISNLQYLTPLENRMKGSKLDWKNG